MTLKQTLQEFGNEFLSYIAMSTLVLMVAVPVSFIDTGAAQAASCTSSKPKLHNPCGPMPHTTYKGGGVNAKVVPLTACLPTKIWEDINETWWDVGFYYEVDEPEEVATVEGRYQCWTHTDGNRQHGAPGAWVVAYINCDSFRGWVGGVIKSNGRADLRPMDMPRHHDPMR